MLYLKNSSPLAGNLKFSNAASVEILSLHSSPSTIIMLKSEETIINAANNLILEAWENEKDVFKNHP
jgi:hypothetical protein